MRSTWVSPLVVEALAAAIDLVPTDDDFTDRAGKLIERDHELLDRCARRRGT